MADKFPSIGPNQNKEYLPTTSAGESWGGGGPAVIMYPTPELARRNSEYKLRALRKSGELKPSFSSSVR